MTFSTKSKNTPTTPTHPARGGQTGNVCFINCYYTTLLTIGNGDSIAAKIKLNFPSTPGNMRTHKNSFDARFAGEKIDFVAGSYEEISWKIRGSSRRSAYQRLRPSFQSVGRNSGGGASHSPHRRMVRQAQARGNSGGRATEAIAALQSSRQCQFMLFESVYA